METKDTIGIWIFFVIVGTFILLMLFSIFSSTFPPKIFETTEKINPEWQLVTDGKVVDTLWIYKIK